MHNKPRMVLQFLSIPLCAGLLTGCLTAGGQASSSRPATSSPPASSSSEADAPPPVNPDGGVDFTLMLPSGMSLFGERLSGLAAADGNQLTVRTSPAGAQYQDSVATALEGQSGPDLFWLEGEASLLELSAETTLPLYDPEGNQASQLMHSLAGMVPDASRLTGHGGLAGLPLGYYTEGYLVNLELLEGLLGAQAGGALLENLYACSWDQWVLLVRSIQSYLAQPGRIELRLGSQKYTTPNFRPGLAQPLRGIFAVATEDTGSLVGNALDILMGLCYEDPATMLAAANSEKLALSRPALASLMGMLELETMHMTQKTGALRRGEDFGQQESYSAEEAVELFAAGNALFLRTDSRQGIIIEQEYPELAGKLAMIPVKLPNPTYLEESEGEAGAASEAATSDSGASSEASSGSLSTPQDPADLSAIPDEVVAEVIYNSNLGLWFAADGLLCVNKNSPSLEAVESLLLRLYTTDAGLKLLEEELGLYTFSRTYPQGQLMQQVAGEVAAGGWQLVAAPSSLVQAKRTVGYYVQEDLLDLLEWGVEEQTNFLTVGYTALGISTS